jgi:hypothetical protein
VLAAAYRRLAAADQDDEGPDPGSPADR